MKKQRYLFMFVAFLFWLPNFLYLPTLSPYLEYMGGNYSFIGIVLSSYGIMQLICRFPIGIGADLLKVRKTFMIIGMLASAISCLLFFISNHLWWFLVARSLAGFAAATWVVFTVFYPSYYEPSQVHKAMSSISFIVVISQFIGMSFSGMLVDEFGWKAPFLLSVIFSTVGFILSFFIKETEEINKQPIKLKQVAAVLKDSLLLKSAFLSIVAHCMIFSTMFGFTSNYALKIGFETNELTWVVFSFMIPHALATLFIGEVLVPRFGKWKSLKASFLISSISILLFPIIHMKFLFFIIQAISGFFLGLIFPVLLGMSIENIEINKRATAMGAYQALYAIGIFAGPFFTGIINSMMGLEAGFGFVGILGILATILTLIWGNTREKFKKI